MARPATHRCPRCSQDFTIPIVVIWIGHHCRQVPASVAKRNGTFVLAEPIMEMSS